MVIAQQESRAWRSIAVLDVASALINYKYYFCYSARLGCIGDLTHPKADPAKPPALIAPARLELKPPRGKPEQALARRTETRLLFLARKSFNIPSSSLGRRLGPRTMVPD
jgi:hypothetical protein